MNVDRVQRWAMWVLLAVVAIGSTIVYEARIGRIQRENDREFARETLGIQRELLRFLGSGIDQQQQQQQQWVLQDPFLTSYIHQAREELQNEQRSRREVDSRHFDRIAELDVEHRDVAD